MKVKAIAEMPRPNNKKVVEHLLGTVQYLSQFLPKLCICGKATKTADRKSNFYLAAATRACIYSHKRPGDIKSSSLVLQHQGRSNTTR